MITVGKIRQICRKNDKPSEKFDFMDEMLDEDVENGRTMSEKFDKLSEKFNFMDEMF